jgi:hypothetical protein
MPHQTCSLIAFLEPSVDDLPPPETTTIIAGCPPEKRLAMNFSKVPCPLFSLPPLEQKELHVLQALPHHIHQHEHQQ